jgi:hypothetical protein
MGLGCVTPVQPPKCAAERVELIRRAIKVELAARWPKGGLR